VIDTSLLISAAVALTAAWLARRVAPARVVQRRGTFDHFVAAAVAGVLVGRVVALVFDDPATLLVPRDVLLVRGGVEFWAGVGAAALAFLLVTRHEAASPVGRLADAAAPAVVGYAGYEATCVFRGGCYGPHSSLGLRPSGLSTTMLPIGVLAGAALVGAAVVVYRMSTHRPAAAVVIATGGVGAVRSVASLWLPNIGTGLSRPHVTSLVVAVAAAMALPIVWRVGPTTVSSRRDPTSATNGVPNPTTS